MMVKSLLAALFLTLAWPAAAGAQGSAAVKLSPPKFAGGLTVMEALRERKSSREFGPGELNHQQLSELLWAAAGINRVQRPEKPGRTAPTSHDDQAIEVYVFTKNGVYLYDPLEHALNRVLAGDHRAATGVPSYVAEAPVNLIYVADVSLVTGGDDQYKRDSAHMDVGHISENVYLYCASAGLNAIARSTIDRDELKALLGLSEQFFPLLGQTVGLPR